jgi:hypothetical protein
MLTDDNDNDFGAMEDRFDLEQAIMACWHTSDDLEMLSRAALEDKLDVETVANVVQGIEALHKLRCENLFRIFSLLVDAGTIH